MGIPIIIAYCFIRIKVKLRNYEGWAMAIFGIGWYTLTWFKTVGWKFEALYALSFYFVYSFVLFYLLSRRIPMFQSLLATFLITKVVTEFGELPFHINGILIGESMAYWGNSFLALNYLYILIAGLPLLYIMFRPKMSKLIWIFISLALIFLLYVICIDFKLYSITTDAEDIIHQLLYMLFRAIGGIGLAYVFIPKRKLEEEEKE